MSIEKDRLLSLIEYSQQSARLRSKTVASVAAHGLFALYEHEIRGLPGIQINVIGPESEDEIWLTVKRLHEMRHCSSAKPPEQGKLVITPEATVTLSEYDKLALVKAQFSAYLDTKWRLWAEEEKLRRRTIRLYSQLFTLKQQLEGAIVEVQLELVWGVGIGIWISKSTTVCYPVIGRLVELSRDGRNRNPASGCRCPH